MERKQREAAAAVKAATASAAAAAAEEKARSDVESASKDCWLCGVQRQQKPKSQNEKSQSSPQQAATATSLVARCPNCSAPSHEWTLRELPVPPAKVGVIRQKEEGDGSSSSSSNCVDVTCQGKTHTLTMSKKAVSIAPSASSKNRRLQQLLLLATTTNTRATIIRERFLPPIALLSPSAIQKGGPADAAGSGEFFVSFSAPYSVNDLLLKRSKDDKKSNDDAESDLALLLSQQLCDAIADVHSGGYVHGSIRPSNLFPISPDQKQQQQTGTTTTLLLGHPTTSIDTTISVIDAAAGEGSSEAMSFINAVLAEGLPMTNRRAYLATMQSPQDQWLLVDRWTAAFSVLLTLTGVPESQVLKGGAASGGGKHAASTEGISRFALEQRLKDRKVAISPALSHLLMSMLEVPQQHSDHCRSAMNAILTANRDGGGGGGHHILKQNVSYFRQLNSLLSGQLEMEQQLRSISHRLATEGKSSAGSTSTASGAEPLWESWWKLGDAMLCCFYGKDRSSSPSSSSHRKSQHQQQLIVISEKDLIAAMNGFGVFGGFRRQSVWDRLYSEGMCHCQCAAYNFGHRLSISARRSTAAGSMATSPAISPSRRQSSPSPAGAAAATSTSPTAAEGEGGGGESPYHADPAPYPGSCVVVGGAHYDAAGCFLQSLRLSAAAFEPSWFGIYEYFLRYDPLAQVFTIADEAITIEQLYTELLNLHPKPNSLHWLTFTTASHLPLLDTREHRLAPSNGPLWVEVSKMVTAQTEQQQQQQQQDEEEHQQHHGDEVEAEGDGTLITKVASENVNSKDDSDDGDDVPSKQPVIRIGRRKYTSAECLVQALRCDDAKAEGWSRLAVALPPGTIVSILPPADDVTTGSGSGGSDSWISPGSSTSFGTSSSALIPSDHTKFSKRQCFAKALTLEPNAETWCELGDSLKRPDTIRVGSDTFNKFKCYVQAVTLVEQEDDGQSASTGTLSARAWCALGAQLSLTPHATSKFNPNTVTFPTEGAVDRPKCYLKALLHDETTSVGWNLLGEYLFYPSEEGGFPLSVLSTPLTSLDHFFGGKPENTINLLTKATGTEKDGDADDGCNDNDSTRDNEDSKGEEVSAKECFMRAVKCDESNALAWRNAGLAFDASARKTTDCIVLSADGGERFGKKQCLHRSLLLDGTDPIAWAAMASLLHDGNPLDTITIGHSRYNHEACVRKSHDYRPRTY